MPYTPTRIVKTPALRGLGISFEEERYESVLGPTTNDHVPANYPLHHGDQPRSYPPFILGTLEPHRTSSPLPGSSRSSVSTPRMMTSPLSSPLAAGVFQPYIVGTTQGTERSPMPEYILVSTAVGAVAGIMVIGLGGIFIWILIKRQSLSPKAYSAHRELRNKTGHTLTPRLVHIHDLDDLEAQQKHWQAYPPKLILSASPQLSARNQFPNHYSTITSMVSQHKLKSGSRPRSASLPIAMSSGLSSSSWVHDSHAPASLDIQEKHSRTSCDSVSSSTETQSSRSATISFSKTEDSMTSHSACSSNSGGSCINFQKSSTAQLSAHRTSIFMHMRNGMVVELDGAAPFMVLKFPPDEATSSLVEELAYLPEESALFGSVSRDIPDRKWISRIKPDSVGDLQPTGDVGTEGGQRTGRDKNMSSFAEETRVTESNDDASLQHPSTEEGSRTPSESGLTTGSLSTNNSYASICFASTLLVEEQLPPPSILISAPTLATLSESTENSEDLFHEVKFNTVAASSSWQSDVGKNEGLATFATLISNSTVISGPTLPDQAEQLFSEELGLNWFGHDSVASGIDSQCTAAMLSRDDDRSVGNDHEKLYVSPFVIGDADSEDEDSADDREVDTVLGVAGSVGVAVIGN
ncbi:hypothetical protein FRC03_003455 [Tulasnella sp. 419]|nr:hypothetical protein FRC03_003455 [Tulasnella sp. 419]